MGMIFFLLMSLHTFAVPIPSLSLHVLAVGFSGQR
jgi:hypothetical protein